MVVVVVVSGEYVTLTLVLSDLVSVKVLVIVSVGVIVDISDCVSVFVYVC